MTTRTLAGILGLTAFIGTASSCGSGGAGEERTADSTAGSTAAERERVLAFWILYREATTQRIAGETRAAAVTYARALDLNPGHEDALYYLGNMRLSLGDFSAAENAWRRLAELNPASARAHSRLGTLHLCLDDGAPFDLDSAEARFRRAHEVNREETGPMLLLAEAALLRGDFPAAQRHVNDVLGSHTGSPAAHFYAGYLAWKAGDGAKAREAFRRAIEGARSAPPTLGVRGEGDTKSGTGPMVSEHERCGQMRQLTSDLESEDPGREMATRYRLLDSLVATARRKNAPARDWRSP